MPEEMKNMALGCGQFILKKFAKTAETTGSKCGCDVEEQAKVLDICYQFGIVDQMGLRRKTLQSVEINYSKWCCLEYHCLVNC